ncbi:MAG: hypothetical protein K1060chlam4_00279 [Candidatus Anoxychlamydiales bacterium]|nr:hypothetical protein [Candidatus Anoxychlamydiales bacterium]
MFKMNNLSSDVILKRFFIFLIFLCLSPLFELVILEIFHSEMLELNKSLKMTYKETAFDGMLGLIFMFPILYHCVYKKKGTRWLTVSLWFSFLSFLSSTLSLLLIFIIFIHADNSFFQMVLDVVKDKAPLGSFNQKTYLWMTIFICNCVIEFMLLNYILYGINIRNRNILFRYRRSLKSDDYKEAYVQIDSASNFQELKSIYSELIERFPEIKKLLNIRRKRKKKFIRPIS